MTAIRLSEAIRLGSVLAPQCFSTLYQHGNGEVIATCALGSSLHAIGLLQANGVVYEQIFPLAMLCTDPPIEGCCETTVCGIIISLNDRYQWTREKIADWVEGIEREHEHELEVRSSQTAEAEMEPEPALCIG